MKKPKTPPDWNHAWGNVLSDPNRLAAVMASVGVRAPPQSYFHWNDLIRRTPPEGLSLEEWWVSLKMRRNIDYRTVPLRGKQGNEFQYVTTDSMIECLHYIDMGAGGKIELPEPITNRESRDRYSVSSLMEEAITSSQIEGAVTTRKAAKEMLQTRRAPRDHGEKMVLNNFLTMRHIGKLRNQLLTPDTVFEVHRLMTEGTLDDSTAAGRFRRGDEEIVVTDIDGEIYHDPPPANELPERLRRLCDFANGVTPGPFLHPVLRAIILHFWLAYDHPFVDGNGRTARALFYWCMLHNGYWLFEYLSISRVIYKSRSGYYRAFLYTESDDNDLTYFLLHQVDVIQKSINELHEYIRLSADRDREMQGKLHALRRFNHRQQALITHALRHPTTFYTIAGHQLSHEVTYQTARNDLLTLANDHILEMTKSGKKMEFTPAPNLEQHLGTL